MTKLKKKAAPATTSSGGDKPVDHQVHPNQNISKFIEPKLTACIVESFVGGDTDEHGRYVGIGKAIFRDGNTYEGDWVNGIMHGKGEYRWRDGATYIGSFEENEMTGQGRLVWPDGSVYEGHFVRGVRHGEGTMKLTSLPSFYQGGWCNGKRQGKGILYYDGEEKQSYYDGEWQSGKRHGSGTLCYASGNTYVGEWQNDTKSGRGKMSWKSLNEVYEGNWADDKPWGSGEHVWLGERAEFAVTERQMCNRYTGEFVNGLRCGQGTFFFSNGSRYIGQFKNNQKHGQGVYSFPDGRVYEGPFVEDRMAFSDSALEEKSPTKGPIKSPTKALSKKQSMTSDGGRKQPPQVLAGTSRNVMLNVGDLMPNLAPLEVLKERRAIDNVIMRWNTDLKRIYNDYATRVNTKNHAPNTFTMSLAQFWRFAEDCDLVSRPLPFTVIDRCFHETRVQLASAVVLARRRREASERGVAEDQVPAAPDSMYLETESNLHAPEHPILFREFVEVLARIASRIYDGVKPLLSEQLQLMLSTKIGRERCPSDSVVPRDEVDGDLQNPSEKMIAYLEDNQLYLQSLFERFAHDGDELGQADRTMYVRDFAQMLRACGVVYVPSAFATSSEESVARRNTITLSDATQLYLRSRYAAPLIQRGQSNTARSSKGPAVDDRIMGDGEPVGISYEFDEDDDEGNFQYEMIYAEFVESLARVGFKWHEAKLLEQKRKAAEEAVATSAAEEKAPGESGELEDPPPPQQERPADEKSAVIEALPELHRLSTLGALKRLVEGAIKNQF